MARKPGDAAERKAAEIAETRRTGLDLCDRLVDELCSRGLLTVTREVLERLGEVERSLQSHKLMRFSREVAAIRARFSAELRRGAVSARVFADRLRRLQAASSRLRSLLDDPYADSVEIEELAGHTWREGDLKLIENLALAELAWESVHLEEGFRVDTSYFLSPSGEVLCERKIVPLNLRAAVDTSLKPERPGALIYPNVGLFPGDLPRRVKLMSVPNSGEGIDARVEERIQLAVRKCPRDLAAVRSIYLERRERPFPPESLPLLLAPASVYYESQAWWIVDEHGDRLPASPAEGMERQPTAAACMGGFVEAALSVPFEVLLLLVHDDGARIQAMPAGAITADGPCRFGLDR